METWRLRDGVREQSVPVPGSSFACTIAPTADGALAAVNFENDIYPVVDLRRGAILRTLRSTEGFEAGAATFNARGTRVALGNSNSVTLWEAASGRRLDTLRIGARLPFTQSVRILSLAVSVDERLVAAGCNDGYVRIWRP